MEFKRISACGSRRGIPGMTEHFGSGIRGDAQAHRDMPFAITRDEARERQSHGQLSAPRSIEMDRRRAAMPCASTRQDQSNAFRPKDDTPRFQLTMEDAFRKISSRNGIALEIFSVVDAASAGVEKRADHFVRAYRRGKAVAAPRWTVSLASLTPRESGSRVWNLSPALWDASQVSTRYAMRLVER